VTGDKPSVVPVGTEFLFGQSYPGLTVVGYFHAIPSGLRRAKESFPPPSKTYFEQVGGLIAPGPGLLPTMIVL
jgi:hypothetical protein